MLPEKNLNRDYYQLLGVDRDASEQQIRDAYHSLAWTSEMAAEGRPGKDADKGAGIKLLVEAFNILSDPAERARYDRSLLESSSSEMQDLTGAVEPAPAVGPAADSPHPDPTMAISRSTLQETIQALKDKYAAVTKEHESATENEAMPPEAEDDPPSLYGSDAETEADWADSFTPEDAGEAPEHFHEHTEILEKGRDFPDPSLAFSAASQPGKNSTEALRRAEDLGEVFTSLTNNQEIMPENNNSLDVEFQQPYRAASNHLVSMSAPDGKFTKEAQLPNDRDQLGPKAESNSNHLEGAAYFRPRPRPVFNARCRQPNGFFNPPNQGQIDWTLWIVGCGPPLLTLIGVAIYYLTR